MFVSMPVRAGGFGADPSVVAKEEQGGVQSSPWPAGRYWSRTRLFPLVVTSVLLVGLEYRAMRVN